MKRTHSLGRPNTSSNRFRATEKATEIAHDYRPPDEKVLEKREVSEDSGFFRGVGTVVKIEMVMGVIIPIIIRNLGS